MSHRSIFYTKVHEVHIKFWLIMAHSASGHSFSICHSLMVMTYSLAT